MGRTGFAIRLKSLLAAAVFVALLTANGATSKVTLAWDPSPGTIAGYRVYQGIAPLNYTAVANTKTASATMSNLVIGVTYYFAVSAYDSAGLESALSSEISYTVPPPPVRLKIRLNGQQVPVLFGSGVAGYTYDLLLSTDLINWSVYTNVVMDADGAFSFAETPGAGTPRFFRLHQTTLVAE